MKVDLLGAKCPPSAALIDHTVVPFVGLPASSVHVKTVPPHSWTSIPRCCLYQARSATGSFELKKIPPIPVTLFIEPPKCRQVGAYCVPPTRYAKATLPLISQPMLQLLWCAWRTRRRSPMSNAVYRC